MPADESTYRRQLPGHLVDSLLRRGASQETVSYFAIGETWFQLDVFEEFIFQGRHKPQFQWANAVRSGAATKTRPHDFNETSVVAVTCSTQLEPLG